MALVRTAPVHHLQHERLSRRRVEGVHDAEQKGEQDDVPRRHHAGEGERREHERQEHAESLSDDEHAPSGHTVRDDPAPESEDPTRQSGGKTRVPEVGRGARDLVDEVAEGRALHPGAEERHHLAEEPEPVVGIGQRREGAPFSRRGPVGLFQRRRCRVDASHLRMRSTSRSYSPPKWCPLPTATDRSRGPFSA